MDTTEHTHDDSHTGVRAEHQPPQRPPITKKAAVRAALPSGDV
jgi:hypothetical protein